MSHDVPYLRLYAPDSADTVASELAARELLRPVGERGGGRDLEPLSRAWFEEIEIKRYARAGEWLPRMLEFSRHKDESLVMLGPGLGSDALQYLRHGTKITIALAPTDPVEALRRNFLCRGLEANMINMEPADCLPFPNGRFDLAYLNCLHGDHSPAVIGELYRVLKAGGKLFALVPAWYEIGRWQRWLFPHRQLYGNAMDPLTGTKRTSRELRRLFSPFESITIQKRHLRRSELPPIWRTLPVSLMERLFGRILALRSNKPIRIAQTASQSSAA